MKLKERKCAACTDGLKSFDRDMANEYMAGLKNWSISLDGKWILKEFKFKNFLEALEFVKKVAAIAEEEQHHPNIDFTWGYCKISIQTHKVDGLTENDFILAAKIDEIS
ncbi:MAG: 4a-hydroxytetrahydrobiopterin dehydratase [Pseudomonadota bacterium]